MTGAPASQAPSGLHLVFGASGYIGGHLVPRLLREGLSVRAAARNPAVLEGRGWDGAELVRGDALEPETLADVLEGVDVAYYLVHSMAAGRGFSELDREAARNFGEAARRAGVRSIVYLGGLLPQGAESEHLVSRADTGTVLREAGVPVTEIRAGIIVGPGSAAFEVIRDLVNNLPVMVTPRWVRSRTPPIALDNLLEYLIRVPGIEEARGGTFDVAGPEMLSYEDLMRQFGEIVGRRPRILPVPVLSPGLSSYWLALVTAVPSAVARALIGGLAHDIPARPEPLRRLVAQELLSYRESVRAALKAEADNAVASRWIEGALMFRGYRQDHAYYAKKAAGSALTAASPEAVWRVINTIGGKTRYFYMNALWKVREILDWIVGGPGLNYARRDPQTLRLGDYVDSWQVVAMEPPNRLTLGFGMRAPGSGVLEFEVVPVDGGTRVTVTAYWHPAGVWGLAYWYAFAPAHLFIFKGMTREIARRAERLDRP
jgi:uncharacterized protein YbjT (DUF2867 family)/uncharacterized protein YndB with AHSA1/START domain